MDYTDTYRVISFLVDTKEEKYVNELLDHGWKILNIVQYKDENIQYGQYALGATKEVYDHFNFDTIKARERKTSVEKYGFQFVF